MVERADARFWLVWSPQAVMPPKRRFRSKASARAAAEEMAALHAGRQFFVLEAVALACTPAPNVAYVELEA